MRLAAPTALALILLTLCPRVHAQTYPLGPDSMVQVGVPHGTVTHSTFTSKTVFPGTVRDCWVYVPAEYDGKTPACLMVFQDGGWFADTNSSFRVPVVCDNLIYHHQMPVTIVVMVNPGVVPAANSHALARYNRSLEYDSMSGRYVRFLNEELLPALIGKYHISSDPSDRAIGGISSGGSCAFTAAWERPDCFRRVLSFVGSFTDLRGADRYPSLIRKSAPRPIRVFMQDATHDLDIYPGSWYLNAQSIADALRYSGYAVKFVVGSGGHDGIQGGAIMPDALRWLWRGYPDAVRAAATSPQHDTDALMPRRAWSRVSSAGFAAGAVASAPDGSLYLAVRSGGIERFNPQGKPAGWLVRAGNYTALACKADGVVVGALNRSIVEIDGNGNRRTVARGFTAGGLVANHAGDIYASDPGHATIWLIPEHGHATAAVKGANEAGALALSPDQTLLLAASRSPGRYIWSYQIGQEGQLHFGQPYFDLFVRHDHPEDTVSALTTLTDGELVATTPAGLDLFDQAGRTTGVVPLPARKGAAGAAFCGGNGQTLVAVAADGAVYIWPTQIAGAMPFATPSEPAAPIL
ncbi:MAG: gluconolactonase [Armatimonadetes bacterium]|nr:gluconolactonase [Armatimonadota bacterium]MDE2206686.1 gluconolactonase [Armatimonadota bacterium]